MTPEDTPSRGRRRLKPWRISQILFIINAVILLTAPFLLWHALSTHATGQVAVNSATLGSTLTQIIPNWIYWHTDKETYYYGV